MKRKDGVRHEWTFFTVKHDGKQNGKRYDHQDDKRLGVHSYSLVENRRIRIKSDLLLLQTVGNEFLRQIAPILAVQVGIERGRNDIDIRQRLHCKEHHIRYKK